MFENSDSFRDGVDLERYGVNPTLTFAPGDGHEDHRRLRVPARHSRRRSRHHVVSGAAGRRRSLDVLRQPGRQPRARATSTSASATVEHRTGSVTIRNRTLVGDYDRSYQNFVPGAVTRGREPGRADGLQQRHRADERLQPDRRHLRAIHRTAHAHAARRRRGRPAADRQLPQHRLLQQHRDVDARAVRRTRRSPRR